MFDQFRKERQYETLDLPCDEDNSGYLDGGVVFFVGAILAMGGKTMFSCEGHPNGFYIKFNGNTDLADKIRSAGFFNVSSCGTNQWEITLLSEDDKLGQLRQAASDWTKRFQFDEAMIETALTSLRPA